MTATTTPLVTFEELERIPDSEGRYELHHGELIKLPPPKHGHHSIQRRLRQLLESTAGEAWVVEIEVGLRALPEYEYRVADVAVVSKTRWDRTPDNGYLEGAPEIVIEVVSPSNSAAEMLDREQLCLENGSLEFWVVNPFRKQVKVSTPDGRTVTCRSGSRIPLLFGGSLEVDAIFV